MSAAFEVAWKRGEGVVSCCCRGRFKKDSGQGALSCPWRSGAPLGRPIQLLNRRWLPPNRRRPPLEYH